MIGDSALTGYCEKMKKIEETIDEIVPTSYSHVRTVKCFVI